MERDEREVGEPGSDKHRTCQIHPEDTRKSSGPDIWRSHLHLLGPRVGQARDEQDAERYEGGHKQHGKGDLVLASQGQYSGNDQWTDKRP